MGLFMFKLPDIGEGIAECEIATWRVAVGDVVKDDQPLVDMLTDKAAVEIPSPVSGVVKELRGAAGDKVSVGAVLLVIETAAEVAAPPAKAAPAPATAPAKASASVARAAAAAPVATGSGSSFSFKLPDIGEGIAECEIASWRVAVGDMVAEDQPLVDMLTEKAAVEIPSPVAGVVRELRGAAGDKIAVGAVMVVFEVSGGDSLLRETGEGRGGGAAVFAEPLSPAAAAGPHPAVGLHQSAEGHSSAGPTAPPLAQGRGLQAPLRAEGEKPLAAPSVRKHARELGIDLALVPGSLKGGRVGHEDLRAYQTAHAPSVSRLPSPVSPANGVELIKIIGLRRKIAEAMQRSKRNIPHFAYVEEVDVTELEALRVHLNETRRADQPKLTILPFLMQALVKAVPAFPMVNSTYDDVAGVVSRYQALHIGIAAQTPQGLVVPVAKHAETMDIWKAASEIKRLAEAARSGKAKREELSGSTITITSLGPMGGIASTPVINAPEVAIIGVNKMVERPMVRNGQVVIRTMMNLSSSFDHRIVDGWDAASFIQKVKGLLEHPATLFM